MINLLLPRKLGKRTGKIGTGERLSGKVGIGRLIPGLFLARFVLFEE